MWLILLPVAIVFVVLGSVYLFFKPSMRTWVINQIQSISASQLPVEVRVKDVNWSLLLPSIEISEIEIIPTGKDLKDFKPVKIEKISAGIEFFQLLAGRIGLSTVLIEKPQIEIDLDPLMKQDSKPSVLPLDEVFKALKKLPVSRIALLRAQVRVFSKKMDFEVDSKSLDTLLVNRRDKIFAQIRLDETEIKAGKEFSFPLKLESTLTLDPNTLLIGKLKLGAFNSVMSAQGKLTNFKNIMVAPEGAITVDTFLDLKKALLVLPKQWKVPEMKGIAKIAGDLSLGKGTLKSTLQFNGKSLAINQFEIGDMQFDAVVSEKHALINKLAITSEAGLIDVTDVNLGFDFTSSPAHLDVQAKLQSEFVDLHELLLKIGVGDVPVEAFIQAKFNCGGPILPDTKITCSGNADAEEFEVRSGNGPTDLIASLSEFGARGDVTITQKDISYKADLKLIDSSGKSDGVISYSQGFKINYSSPDLKFKNVRYLAGLKIEGAGEVTGNTSGGSHAAEFVLNLKGKNVFFEDFFLGEPQGSIKYSKGTLYFDNLSGLIETTAYQAKVRVNLLEKRIWAQGQTPQFQVPDLMKVFARRFQLPIEVLGSGSASATVEGPFALGKLSYELNAVVLQGTAAGESFDRVDFSVSSNSGEAKINKAVMIKNNSQIAMTGVGHPNGDIAIKINGNRLMLEESENVSKLGAPISGVLDFEMSLNGFILTPDSRIVGKISELNIAEQEFPASNFDVTFTRRTISGTADMIGGQLKSQFTLPMETEAPFKLKLIAKEWNYATLFTLIGGASLLSDYDASLTGVLDLSADSGGIFKSSGTGKIEKFLLQRGSLSLQNRGPMELITKNGLVSLSNFKLIGDRSSFEVKGSNFSKDDLNLRIDGVANLRLLQIFVPFLEELAGSAQIAINTSGSLEKPQILGSAGIQNGYVKIKGFPHAFERIAADVQFSQSRVNIASFRGILAGGSFEGDGSILIEGIRNLPMNIKANITNANFDVPEGFRTSGDADVVFSGNWFPFLLSGTYRVRNGSITSEFGQTSSGGPTLRQSSYLPKVILQSAFEPVILDLNVILEKPVSIKNSLIEGAVTGQIQVKGPPTTPGLLGRVNTTPGTKVFARDKAFEVQTANVQFNDMTTINPELYVAGRARVSDYDISLLVQGKASDPKVRLTSTPPLSEQDIVSLLALGITSQQQEKNVSGKGQEKNLNAEAGNVLVGTIFGRGLQDYGFDLKYTSSYDDVKNIAVQKFTLSRKITDRLNASTSRLIGQQSSTEVKLQYFFNPTISAIGSWENREATTDQNPQLQQQSEAQSIFGLDLEFKREFK